MMGQNLDVRILETLVRWEKEAGSLPEILALYRDVLHVQHEIKNALIPLPASNESSQECLKNGTPLISFYGLGIDQSKLSEALIRILAIMTKYLVLSEKDKRWLKHLVSDGASLYQVARNWYEGADNDSWNDGVDQEFVATTMQAILCPWLRTRVESLEGGVDTANWRRPYCPVCGGKPDFSYLRIDDGSRWLSCFRCDNEWLFQRLECPFCRNTDQKDLAVFSDDSYFRRVEICHKCQTYIKSVDLRKTKGDVLIPLEKVLAVNLSWEGQNSFRPGWLR